MASKTEIVKEFVKLDSKAAKQIKNIREDPEYAQAIKDIQQREQELGEIKKALDNLPPSDINTEARQGLSREPTEKIKSKQELFHDYQVKEAQLKIQRDNLRRTEIAVIQKHLPDIEDIVKNYGTQTVQAFENLLECLKQQDSLYSFLRFKGFCEEARPAHWRMTFAETKLLHGGYPGIGLLAEYTAQRKKAWNLDGDK